MPVDLIRSAAQTAGSHVTFASPNDLGETFVDRRSVISKVKQAASELEQRAVFDPLRNTPAVSTCMYAAGFQITHCSYEACAWTVNMKK